MADPAIQSTGSSSTPLIQDAPDVGAASSPPPPPPLTDSDSSSVEPYSGDLCAPANSGDVAGPALSRFDLEAAQANENQARKGLRDSLAGPLDALAKKHPDPVGLLGSVDITPSELRWGLQDAMQSDSMREALSHLSKGSASDLIREQVQRAWPQGSKDDVEKIATQVVGAVGEHLLYDAGLRMRDTAVAMMSKTADAYTKLAADPAKLKELTQTIRSLDVGSSEDQALGTRLREGLGITEGRAFPLEETTKLAGRINGQATILRATAKELSNVDGDRVFRAMAGHDARDAFKQATGIQQGSWAAQGVDAAAEKAESDKKSLEYVKLATTLATIPFTAGLGASGAVGLVFGLAETTLYSAPGLAETSREVNRATAGEAAGTMHRGARAAAETNATMEKWAFVASLALGPVAGHAGEAFSEVVGVVGHKVAEATAEVAVHGSIEAAVIISQKSAADGDDLGLSALERVNLKAASQRLAQLSPSQRQAFDAAATQALNQQGVPQGDQRLSVLLGLYAQCGADVATMNATQLGAALARPRG